MRVKGRRPLASTYVIRTIPEGLESQTPTNSRLQAGFLFGHLGNVEIKPSAFQFQTLNFELNRTPNGRSLHVLNGIVRPSRSPEHREQSKKSSQDCWAARSSQWQ